MCNEALVDSHRLLAHLKELRVKKNSGELDDEASLSLQETRWRNRLDYDLISSCLQNFNEDVRLEVLGLLVESKKSTLVFNEREFHVILQFLTFNLGERLEFVPLIKKTFKRMKESLAVLKRQTTQVEKIESCRHEVRDNLQLYEQLKKEYEATATRSLASIAYYRKFFTKIREICLNGLCPGSTHTRKKNSLRILQLQEELLSPDFRESPWTPDQADKLLQCLLLDTYETNKEVSFRIITNISPCLLKLDNEERVDEIINVALRLGNSIRPIDSITAGYMFKVSLLSPVIENVLLRHLKIDAVVCDADDVTLWLIIVIIEQLREPARLANENIIIAAARHSLYGYLFCIKLLLSICDLRSKHDHSLWRRTVDDLIGLCLSLNKSVSQIVNNSSPEGHFPMDLDGKHLNEDVDDVEVAVTPQMVLLCSWRTVKEVSLLFGYLSEKSPIEGGGRVGLLSGEQIVEIGDHLVTLLCETKHRGAFEQAHVGFEQLCRRLWRAEEERLKQLPKLWLYQVLLDITGLSPGNSKLCATRRSAGVPFMVQALIASAPSVSKKSDAAVFHSVMRILLGLTEFTEECQLSGAKELLEKEDFFKAIRSPSASPNSSHSITMTEVKTHALNILRALFKHAQLGDLTRAYAADGLIAAIKSYDEKTWAERNAATLLYSSLITRIFGVQRTKDHVNLTVHNKMTGRIFFEKYPKLLPFMLHELKVFIEASDGLIKPSVQSILLLLSRLYLSYNSDSGDVNWRIDEFVSLVSGCAKSRVYNTRELAARALVPLLTGKTVGAFVNSLFEVMINRPGDNVNLNLLHGYMLQILEITKSSLLTAPEAPKLEAEGFVRGSEWILQQLETCNDRPAAFPLATALVNVFCELVRVSGVMESAVAFDGILRRLLRHINGENSLKDRPGREVYEAAAAGFLISLLDSKLGGFEAVRGEEYWGCWGSMLSHANYQVQIVAWERVVRAVEVNSSGEFSWRTLRLALEGVNSVRNDPDLQSVIFEFLCEVFDRGEGEFKGFYVGDNRLLEISETVLRIFRGDLPQDNASFFRLLGKTFGRLIRSSRRESQLIADVGSAVYEGFREHSWMGSAGIDCRIAIAGVIHDIYADSSENGRKCINYENTLNWWTTLLNLLVDDSNQVRKLASIALSKVPPESEVKCDSHSLELFFYKFSKIWSGEGGLLFAAYFVWSLALAEGDYEMDDSDVFNKCYNYESFEPLRISSLCEEYLNTLSDHYDIHAPFPAGVQTWLIHRLNIESSDCQDAQALITSYRNRLPPLSNKLDDILDPTCNDKLLQSLAFEKFLLVEEPHYHGTMHNSN
ncbi:thyroid adenoma-associated protein homolog [Diachasma alloeum]|uniref:thyroid adenoma-associated protein homolog n=1 Tax=Diachasma alloeum TaxID=454923 RepID=UPI00073816EB|nr:thyroid adenoma-associated protein homolog [Diachasma alloeum]